MKEAIRLKIRKYYIAITKRIRRNRINKENFTIISNNCWGGLIYQSYGLEYQTPTIGLFIMPDDYLKFISNLRFYVNQKLVFINPKDSKYYTLLKYKSNWGTYPIGKLHDIEIHFLHYKTDDEARKKWYRRVSRINYNYIIYKFNDQNFCTKEQIDKFMELNLPNKICFVSKQYRSDTIYIASCSKYSSVKASYEPFGNNRFININEFINHL